jgi:transcriptional regulator with XRE-family HTH domain
VSKEEEYAVLIKHIADNIKSQRKKNALTQADLEEFGFDIKNYQKLEYGKHQFSLHTVFRLSRAFGCPIDDLVKEPKKKRSPKK